MLHPGEVSVAGGRDAVFPALVIAQALTAPVAHIERRVGKDIVGLEVGVAVGVEGVAVSDLAVDAADGEVHARQPPRGVVRFLTVDADVALGFAAVAVTLRVRAYEFHRLHEHAR